MTPQDLPRQFEGCALAAYPDPVSHGAPWTIGWGHTKGVAQGMTCTQAQADQWLADDMAAALATVAAAVKVPLSAGERDALGDFVFNLGAGNFRTSTLLRLLNAGDYAGASAEFKKWDMGGGHVVAGLLRRRLAEQAEFDGGAQ